MDIPHYFDLCLDEESSLGKACFVECGICNRIRVAAYSMDCDEFWYFMNDWSWKKQSMMFGRETSPWEHVFNACGAKLKNGKVWNDLPHFVCLACQASHMNTIRCMADVAACFQILNTLERAIREKRNQNNRRSANTAGKLCKSCGARNDGHSASRSLAQAGEEHHRVFVLRNKDRDVQARGRTAVREIWRTRNRQSRRVAQA